MGEARDHTDHALGRGAAERRGNQVSDHIGGSARGYLGVDGSSEQPGMAYWMAACSVYLYIAILGAMSASAADRAYPLGLPSSDVEGAARRSQRFRGNVAQLRAAQFPPRPHLPRIGWSALPGSAPLA